MLAPQRGPVGAGVSAADEEPARLEPDRLRMARRVAPGLEDPHGVAAARELRGDGLAEPRLERERARRRAPRPAVDPARRLHGGLDVEAEIDDARRERDERLGLTLARPSSPRRGTAGRRGGT